MGERLTVKLGMSANVIGSNVQSSDTLFEYNLPGLLSQQTAGSRSLSCAECFTDMWKFFTNCHAANLGFGTVRLGDQRQRP